MTFVRIDLAETVTFVGHVRWNLLGRGTGDDILQVWEVVLMGRRRRWRHLFDQELGMLDEDTYSRT